MSVEPAPTTEARPPSPRLGLLPMIIFGSRWLQLPLYLGLIVAQCVYIALFLKELWHLSWHALDLTEQQIMMSVLALIDVVMISNLLVMVIVGGYETFVSRLDLQGHPDEPEWLGHVNASVLKIKLAMAIIGILLDRAAPHLHRGRQSRLEPCWLHRDWRDVAGADPHHLHRLGARHRLRRQAQRLRNAQTCRVRDRPHTLHGVVSTKPRRAHSLASSC